MTEASRSRAARQSAAAASDVARAPGQARYHHGELRRALVDAADALLDEGGPEAVSLREVARRLGVTAPATYRHFEDKETLLVAVAVRGFDEFRAAMGRAAMRAGKDSAHALNEMAQAYVAFALDRPGRFRLMFGPTLADRGRHPALQEAVEGASIAFRGAATAMRPTEATLTMLKAWATIHGLTQLLLDGMLPGQDPQALVRAVLAARS